LRQLVNAVVSQGSDRLIVTVYDADNASIGQIEGIAESIVKNSLLCSEMPHWSALECKK